VQARVPHGSAMTRRARNSGRASRVCRTAGPCYTTVRDYSFSLGSPADAFTRDPVFFFAYPPVIAATRPAHSRTQHRRERAGTGFLAPARPSSVLQYRTTGCSGRADSSRLIGSRCRKSRDPLARLLSNPLRLRAWARWVWWRAGSAISSPWPALRRERTPIDRRRLMLG